MIEKWKQRNDPYAVQKIYVYEHVTEFFDLLEKRYLENILEDIHFILTRGWAKNISKFDFYHGHICGKSKTTIRELNSLLSTSNVCFLYHRFEHMQDVSEAINRNILSFPKAEPKVIHLNYEFGKYSFYGVSSRDLGFMEYARIRFERSDGGSHKLKDGTKLNVLGKFP